MRLLEIKDKIRHVRIPAIIYHELFNLEVETIDENSPVEKQELADELQRAEKKDNVYKVPLSDESKRYLLDNALPNLIDIAEDNMNRRLMNSAKKFEARLYAKMNE